MSDTKDIELKKPSYLADLNPLENELPAQQEDIKIPNIIIAQPLGKALSPSDPGYIEDLKPGQFYNGSTREIIGSVFNAQFIYYFKAFNVYRGSPQDKEWVETLPESEFIKLKNRVYQDFGTMTPDKPDCFIQENWKFVLSDPKDETTDFVFYNVKPGGISDARNWVNNMVTRFKKGENVLTYIWSIPIYSKKSKTSKDKYSYQIDSSKIIPIDTVTKEQYEKAVRIRDQIKKSQAQLLGNDGDYA